MKRFELNYTNVNIILIALLPFFLLTGPFLPNFVVSISSIFFLYYLFTKKKFSFLFSKFFLLYFLFLILILLSSLLSSNIMNSLEHSLFYFRFILFSILLSLFLNLYEKTSDYIFYILILVILFLVLDGFFQFFFKFNIFLLPILNNRISSVFGDEFILGSYLSRFLPLMIALFFLKNNLKKYNEIIIIFLSVLVFLSVYLTGERVAIFNVFISIFCLLILLKSKVIIFYFLIVYVAIISYLVFFSNLLINNRIIQNTINQIGVFDDKKYFYSKAIDAYYHTALNMFYSNPILGVGPKNYRLNCDNLNYAHVDNVFENCNNHPHNIFLQLLSETGIIASLLYLIFYFWVGYNLIKFFLSSFKNKQNNILKFNFFIFLCLFINLSPFFPSGNFFNSWLSTIFYLVFGYVLFIKKYTKIS